MIRCDTDSDLDCAFCIGPTPGLFLNVYIFPFKSDGYEYRVNMHIMWCFCLWSPLWVELSYGTLADKCMAFWGWFLHLKPKFHCAIIYYSVVKSFWDFAQRTTVSLSYLGNFSQWLNAHVPWRYKVSAWNSHHKYYLCNTQISREFLESSRNVSETTPRCVSGAGEEGRGRSWLWWFTVFSRR